MTSIAGRADSHGRRRRVGGRRRAVVAVVVLLLIAVALATSYSAMRSQTVTLNVRQNAMLSVSARQAALTGLTAGLREMHEPDWGGVDTTFGMPLSTNDAFRVEYVAGDTTLTAADVDYEDSPYRVTLVVTGTATDPADSRRVSTHTIRAVARLIPRAVPDEPSDWAAMQDYTFYQTEVRYTTLELPCRLEGTIRLQGKLCLARDYPDDWAAWINYLYHLDQMRWNGYGDYRTVTGRVDYPYSAQDGHVNTTLVNYMSVTTRDVAQDTAAADWTKPVCVTSYRIFPGGPEYEVPRLSGTIQGRTLARSVAENPLGLFYSESDLTLGDNVTLQGTLMCRNEVRINGKNVQLETVDIPPLQGQSLPIQLPVVTCRNFLVRPDADCEVNGLVAVFGRLEVEHDSCRGELELSGKLIAEDFDVYRDTEWDVLDWEEEFDRYVDFDGPSWIYFPVWMTIFGYHCQPTVHIKAGEDVQYHWYRSGESIFVPHEDDFSEMDADEEPGLRWELLEIFHEGG